jgi:hypothetical protein
MIMRKIITVLLVLSGFCSFRAAMSQGVERLQVGWYANGFRLAQAPVFQTKGIQTIGTVELILELSSEGAVKAVKISNGLRELQSIAIESAKSWRFVPVPNLPSTLRTYVYFTLAGGSGIPAMPVPPPPPFGQALGSFVIEGVASDVEQRLRKAVELEVGSVLTAESLEKAGVEARKIDPRLGLSMTLDQDGRPKVRIAPRR